MLKKIEPFILCIVVGFIMGKFMFNQYDFSNAKTVFNDNNKLKFLEMGNYDTKEAMEQAVTSISYYIYTEKDNKFIVYVGITKDSDNLEKLQGYFKEIGYDISVEEIVVTNQEFLEAFNQYELMLKETSDSKAIETIENKILNMYEEYVINIEN